MSVRSGYRRARRKIKETYASIDKVSERVRKEYPITCSFGCSHCCKQAVVITIPEALALLEPLYYDSGKRFWLDKTIFPKARALSDRALSPSGNLDLNTWFEERIPCIFLDTRLGICTIYEDRPFACRELLVTSPPEVCSPPQAPGRKIQIIRSPDAFDVMAITLLEVSRTLQIPLGYCPLPVAIDFSRVILEGGVRKLQTMLAGTIFEDDLQASVFWATKYMSRDQYERIIGGNEDSYPTWIVDALKGTIEGM